MDDTLQVTEKDGQIWLKFKILNATLKKKKTSKTQGHRKPESLIMETRYVKQILVKRKLS